jgi:hypothetical protein
MPCQYAAENRMITQSQLSAFVGKSIAQVCPNGYASDADSHSAHFVSHVLGYNFGVTCQMMGSGRGPAASLRVQEVFAHCARVGVWGLRPATLSVCLVFITRAASVNLAGKVMAQVPRKHVGIFLGGFVWHYSTGQGKVVKQTPAQFSLHYPAPDNAMFYGSLP